MASLNFNTLLLFVIISLMLVASAGGTRKIPVKQEQLIDDISGKAAFNSWKTAQMKAQVDSHMLKKNEGKFPNINHFPEQNHETSKKEESKELVEAENEVAELMRRDYSGKHYWRRVPPINN